MPAAWETAVGAGCGDVCRRWVCPTPGGHLRSRAPGAHGAPTNNLGSQRSQGLHVLSPSAEAETEQTSRSSRIKPGHRSTEKTKRFSFFWESEWLQIQPGLNALPPGGEARRGSPLKRFFPLGGAQGAEGCRSWVWVQVGKTDFSQEGVPPSSGANPSRLRPRGIALPECARCGRRLCK